MSLDCQDGLGEYKFKGSFYSGEFLNSKIHGNGIFKTKKGYSYNGGWLNGVKEGLAVEISKKGHVYKGNFSQNRRHGYGACSIESTKFMKDISYSGNWFYGSMCGQGELTYFRQVKYGRDKVSEKNTLVGQFINGIYQGRLTSPYSDELIWKPFGLKMNDFQNYQNFTEKERKKLKNPAIIEGDIMTKCECLGDVLVFSSTALFRKELSWWSTKDVPAKTKPIILNTRQREFDIIEWHARALQASLNKKKLPCREEK